jgi:hypothetical protein
MTLSNHTRTSRFVIFAALAALTGCGAEAATSTEASTSETTFERTAIDHGHEVRAPLGELDVPTTLVRRASAPSGLEGVVPTAALSERQADAIALGRAAIRVPASANRWSQAWEGADLSTLTSDSPARLALSQAQLTPTLSVTSDSPARLALSEQVSPEGASQLLAAVARPSPDTRTSLHLDTSHTIVVGTDRCETDADCVPDGCHATSCVAAAEMAPGELVCTAELRYGTTDGGGCLCQAGLCAARLTNPPQGI